MCFSEGLGLNLSDYKCSIISYEQISRSSRKEVPMPGDQGGSEGCCTCSIARSNLVNFFISSTTFGYILHNAPHQALPIVNNPSPFINKSVIFLTYEYLNFLTLPCLGSTFVLDISNLSKDQFSFSLCQLVTAMIILNKQKVKRTLHSIAADKAFWFQK